MATGKERIDVLLVEQGFFATRQKAKAAIMAGLVYANNEPVEKAGTQLKRDAAIHVKGAVHPYVSRGGLKLDKALRSFDIDITDAVMLDIGASTGGFTDCALQNGVKYVYAIDVGYNQLDWSLRQDARVCVMERTNFRYMTPDDLTGPNPDFATIDVSFISLQLILPPLLSLLNKPSRVVALIKPQFEAGRNNVGKNGVVRERSVHHSVVLSILQFADQLGMNLEGLTYSPITGGEGNIEFLAYWSVCESTMEPAAAKLDLVGMADQVVGEASSVFTNSPN